MSWGVPSLPLSLAVFRLDKVLTLDDGRAGVNSATILLHEAFTDRYDRSSTSSLNRSLASAKCIVNAMTILYHSSYDLGGIDP